MSYRYLPDVSLADVAFEATAPTLDKLLVECGRATTNAMVRDLSKIKSVKSKKIKVQGKDEAELVRKFIHELIFLKDANSLVFNHYAVKAKQQKGGWVAQGVVKGEKIEPKRHDMLVDVKAVTLHLFEVRQTPSGWKARVVLDV